VVGYLVAALVVALGLAASAVTETAAELSANSMLDTDAGAAIATAPISPDGLIDMRPEAAIVLPARSGG
jgi:hypothetical protein